jgi:organic radical activating enzyme
MDIKLAATTGAPTPWAAHAAFLHSSRPKVCQVKLVVDESAADADLIDVALFLQQHGPEIPLVLQPRTVAGRPAVGGNRLLAMQAVAARVHLQTLVIPQVHPLLAMR